MLNFSTGEDSPLTQKLLGGIIKAEFSKGHVSQRLAGVIMTHGSRLAPSLAQFIPNLLKLVATHPSALVEEFLDIMPYLSYNKDLTTEVCYYIIIKCEICFLEFPQTLN